MAGPVVVPLDGTPASLSALAPALGIARAFGTGVRLVRVFDVPLDTLSNRGGLLGAGDVSDELHVTMAGQLEAAAAQARAAGVPATTEVLEGDDVARTLLDDAHRVDAAAFVMMTHGRGALGRTMLGSVSDRVVRESGRPVVLVSPRAAEHGVAERPLRRVLVPLVDGATASGLAAEHLLTLPEHEGLQLFLVRVATHGTDAPHVDLDELVRRLAAGGIAASAETVASGDAAAAIVAAAREHDVDLIAMITRGERGLARLAHGSTATAVVHSAPVPVLLERSAVA